jgi:PAS domain S-box-containing protein
LDLDEETADPGLADVPAASLLSADGLQLALDQAPDPLFVVDRLWRLRYLNAAAADAWGVDPGDALGRSLWSVHPPLVSGELHDRLAEAMRERRALHVRTHVRGGEAWIGASAYPAADGLLVVQHVSEEPVDADLPTDVRELLEAERTARADAERQRESAERLAAELQAARDTADGIRRAAERARVDAEAAARAKSDFLATMSHELRTPINAITGYTQLLELGIAGPVTDTQRGYLGRLYASGRHLLGLVDDVLDLANIERGRMSVGRDVLSTGPVVAAALALVAPEAAARSIRLVDEVDGNVGPAFVGDEHRVRQILPNLLSNAVKFTAPGGTVTVSSDLVSSHKLTASRSEGSGTSSLGPCVTISVRDTGIGIAPDQQSAIFEPFMQADSSRTRTAGGTGLGLALSRRLARLMGGDLAVESRLGAGSAFTIVLPAYPPDCEAPTPGDESEWEPVAAAPASDETRPPAIEINTLLRAHLEPMLDRFVARLRADPRFEASCTLSRTQLEDHALSLVGAILQSLAIVEESGGLEGDLLRDGSAIQEHIAFRHGEQRYRLGWTEPLIDTEYEILSGELTALARRMLPPDRPNVDRLLDVLSRLLDRTRDVSRRGLQHARRFSEPG